MELILSVAKGHFKDKKLCQSVIRFVSDPVELSLQGEGSLCSFFTSRIHSAWQYKGKRCKANTSALLAVPFDFDNGEMTFDDAVKRFSNYAGVVYTSTNHSDEQPKLRVLLALEKPITDRSAFQPICDWLKSQYPDADDKVFKVSQPLFPCCKYDGGKLTSGYPLFRLRVLEGKPFKFPAEAFRSVKATQAGNTDWPEPTEGFDEQNQSELEAVLAYYNDHPVIEGNRDEELISLCAKFRQCRYTEEDAFAALRDVNKANVQPPYSETGRDGTDKSIQEIVENVFSRRLSPPGKDKWPSLAEALDGQENQSTVTNTSAEEFFASLKNSGNRIHSPAQFFFDDSIYYLVGNDKRQMIVGQGPTYMSKVEAKRMGIKLRDVLPSMRFSDVHAYVSGTRRVAASQVFRDVRNYLTDFLLIPEALNYDYLALWIMGTYSYAAFDAYPYLSVRGDANSGKTTLLERIASLAFNASSPGGMTPSALFHTVTIDAGTVCIDEAEKLKGRDRKEDGVDALEILNMGYKGSGVTTKMVPAKGRSYERVQFSCYSPKAMAGIESLHPTLRTRCHEIKMLPLLPGEARRLRKYQSTRPSIKEREDRIRNDLYIFTLQNFYIPPSVIPSLADVVGRALELWTPIMFLADLVDENNGNEAVSDAMLELLAESTGATDEAIGKDDLGVKLLLALKDLFADSDVQPAGNASFSNDELAYTVDQVYSYLREERPEFSWLDSEGHKKSWLTRMIKELGFQDDRRRVEIPDWPSSDRPVRLYRFNKARFADMLARRTHIVVKPSELTNNDNEESEV